MPCDTASAPDQNNPPREQSPAGVCDPIEATCARTRSADAEAQYPDRHGGPAESGLPADPRPPAREDAEPREARGARHGVRQRLLQLAALRALACGLHDGHAPLAHGRLRQCRRVPRRPADLRALSPRSRLQDGAVGQDAFRRPRPAPRLRGAADHRHLPGRLRLDARLGPARGTALLVPQHELGAGRRHLRAHQPDRFRRRRRSSRPSGPSTTTCAARRIGRSSWSLR